MSEIKNLEISGPAGQLEAQLTAPSSSPRAAAVLCHPHPQYGGSMQDGVLAVAESQLTGQNICSLRFNFRGVGNSDGTYDNGQGEAQDALAAVAWMGAEYPVQPCLLLGYSFGAAAAWRAACSNSQDLAALWLLAPPVGMFDMSSTPGSLPVCVFHPDKDDFTSVATLRQRSADLPGEAPTERLIEQANHFFGGAQDALAAAVGAEAAVLFATS